jgi:hypothetical protein
MPSKKNSTTTHLFKLNKQSPKIILASDAGFKKIEMLEVVSNKLNNSSAPFGIRWSIICNKNQHNCFSWQYPNMLEFNCFELISVCSNIDNTLSKNDITNQKSELHISLEGELIDEDTIIDIKLEMEESMSLSL